MSSNHQPGGVNVTGAAPAKGRWAGACPDSRNRFFFHGLAREKADQGKSRLHAGPRPSLWAACLRSPAVATIWYGRSPSPLKANPLSAQPGVTVIVLTAAAFLGGALNALAGGGSLLMFPALLFAGLNPIDANASSSVALFPATFVS